MHISTPVLTCGGSYLSSDDSRITLCDDVRMVFPSIPYNGKFVILLSSEPGLYDTEIVLKRLQEGGIQINNSYNFNYDTRIWLDDRGLRTFLPDGATRTFYCKFINI